MGKPLADRTHGMRVMADHKERRLTPDQIRRQKNERTKARNAERKKANIAKMESRPRRSPKEQLASLDSAGLRAVKERAKIAGKLKASKVA